eukprot:CAMPEP_0114329398 /NCGR_PEP_ID=MMETSP0101-20121206/1054_1 /TAXON_ID=38822 ORGANISM="Pteridomonas danica, Strain PT" /NCGR_SAMPLE_ID=MMETSP0101 /ASSEMBLY_ACC=CAM_ASM_000211 /LENGTH=1461 /DNA_ID=CAMNT_0001459055 /DNA_START=42 /DNA_END=4424 /DNA_ORIENTATION=-
MTGSFECEECPKGTYGVNNTHCSPCPPGSYANQTGTVNCTLCEIGTVNADAGRVLACEDCDAGTYGPAEGLTLCTDCEVGKYAAETGHGDEGCDDCDRGMAQNKTASTSCFECAPGKLPDDDAINCEYCSAGKEGPGLASERYIVLNGEVIYCDDCDRGKYSLAGATTCTPCEDGYVAETEGRKNCTACGIGKAALSAITCTDCPAGQYGNTTALDRCPRCADGFIQPNKGSKMCRRCEAGTYWHSKTGDFSISDGWTLACSNCTVGTAYDGSEPTTNINACPDCPAGRYSDRLALTECDICEKGTYTNDTGMSYCYGCARGTYLTDNATSDTLHDEAKDCSICAAGRFNNLTGQIDCKDCPKGRYIGESEKNRTDHDDESDCAHCPRGRYGESAGMTVCDACDTGKYLNQSGQTSSSSCTDCDAGTFSATRASTTCDDCPFRKYQTDTGGSFCYTVLQGYYYIDASTDPAACASGYYTDQDGRLNCSACASGYTSINSPNEASTGCKKCSAGTYATDEGSEECTDFPAGYASNDTGRTGVVASTDACNTGYYASSTGSTECTIAPAGKYVPEPEDGVNTAYSSATSCAGGTYSSEAGATSCDACPAGYRCSSGASSPTECNAGYYSTGSVSSCTKCAKGSYQPNTASTSCILCPAGYYKSTQGSSTTCTACPYLTVAVANGSSACGSCASNTFPNLVLAATSCVSQCDEGYIASSYTDDGIAVCEACPANTYQSDTTNGAGECINCPDAYESDEASTSCTVIPTDDTIPENNVAGFNLNEPTQAGSFYSVVGALCLIFLCALILGCQYCINKRNDQRRANEKMSRVSRGIWEEEVLLSIPEDNIGGGQRVDPPEDNPYHLIKTKRLKTRSARRAVEGAFIEEGLKENPPPGCQGFVVVAVSVPVRVTPTLSSSEMCRKYRGDVVYAKGAADGWVQLHESHGDLHGGDGWMSVKKYPNKLAPGVSPLYEFHGNNRNQGGGGLRMFASRMVRAAGLSGVVAMDGLNRDGFSPLKEKEEEADVNLEPLIKDVSAAMNNKKKSEGDGIGVGERWTAPALRGKKGVGSPDKLMGQKRRPTVVLSALSESLGINNKHLRSKKATKGWWVGLSESLGMFADDEEQHELLNDSDSDDETAGGRGGLLGMFNTDPAVQRARTGYVDDAEREVTTALLAARANVSVVRVIEMANTPTDVTPPPSSHIPPEADRLTRPPIDIPEPPILTSTPLATGIIDSQIDHNPTVTTSGSGGGGGELFTETDDTNQEVSTIGLFAEFDYEVIVKSLDVKTMPNSSSSTKKTIYKGDVVIAVESRNGWLKLSEKGNGVAGNGWLCLHMKKGSSQQQSNNHVGHDDDASSLTGIPPPPAYTSSSASSNSFSFMKKKTGSSSSPSPPKPATSKRKSVFQGAMTAIQSTVNLKSSNDNLYDSDENGDLDEFSKSSNMMNGNNDNYQPTVKLLGEHNSNAVPL